MTATAELNIGTTRFTYDHTQLNDIQVDKAADEKGKMRVVAVRVKDEVLQPTKRFWTSLFATFGFNNAFFKYFDEAEVFDRISSVEKRDLLRVCVERDVHPDTGAPTARLLGVSKPTKALVSYEDLMGHLNIHSALGIQYSDGVVESFHAPRVGGSEFEIAGDMFNNRFVLATPIDGYGSPNVYLSLLRQVCKNGAIAYAKAFRSSIALGKAQDNTEFSITRVLDQFGNDEGYAALRDRFESSAKSWASVYETTSLYKLLVKLLNAESDDGSSALETSYDGLASTPFLKGVLDRAVHDSSPDSEQLGSPVLRAFHSMTGDTSRLYGLANLDALSVKRQRTLPTKATMYDCINFATEVATHHANVPASRMLQAWVGTAISSEYDMENTMEKFADFADFHVTSKLAAGLTGSEYKSN